jgi:hypothetical protein
VTGKAGPSASGAGFHIVRQERAFVEAFFESFLPSLYAFHGAKIAMASLIMKIADVGHPKEKLFRDRPLSPRFQLRKPFERAAPTLDIGAIRIDPAAANLRFRQIPGGFRGAGQSGVVELVVCRLLQTAGERLFLVHNLHFSFFRRLVYWQ